MFSFLDMVNHYLGYFNISTTLKSRIYTILGMLGDGYLFYVGIRLLKNQYYSRGSLVLLVAVILLYLTICNLFYYFTKVQFKLDASPVIAKLLHLHPKPTADNSKAVPTNLNQSIPSNGFFDTHHILPAKVKMDLMQQENLNSLVIDLERSGLLRHDYQGLDDKEIQNTLQNGSATEFYAIGKGVMIPCFEMRTQDHQLVIYGGMNQANLLPIGNIQQVGLQYINTMDLTKIKLYLASVEVVGGSYKSLGRSNLTEHTKDYQIRTRVAYEVKD
ncbi:DUF6681 family protein [Lentilactobacillus laojiaonis]|uniref:DUF6681 family protein n=1 Tax=Lentilactobacillus laojiaonis TaxID=2883998 RepID=UPI001D0AE701|nr:DUF6681 family protein [Lentilactobacillus laojiaonis]UDM32324.1 hypothetical protein LHL71_00875 [Lentilactobacillus laojiaonis]